MNYQRDFYSPPALKKGFTFSDVFFQPKSNKN
jgi:hypothetical protein